MMSDSDQINISVKEWLEPERRTLAKEQYVHIFVVGLMFAAFDAYGIGSNDVANAFATSVGAKSLSLKSACIIALFTEFIGAVTLGSEVADTIKGKILNVKDFAGQSETLMLGMFCSSIGSSLWVNLASYIGMPVSTTHATVGATIGVGIAFGGSDAVLWGECNSGDCTGVLAIISSWGLSPALAGAFGAAIFLFTKYAILKPGGETSYWRARMLYPVYIGVTWTIVAFFMILKGAPELNEKYEIYEKKKTSSGVSHQEIKEDKILPVIGIALAFGAFFAVIAAIWVNHPRAKAWFERSEEEEAEIKAAKDAMKPDVSDQEGTMATKLKGWAMSGLNKDVTTITDDLIGAKHAQTAHDKGVKYYEPTERVFMAVQVFTAAFASLAHGANDVANAIAPLCTVYHVWNTGYKDLGDKSATKVPVETWILAYGGLWIDIGLTFSGWRIMKNLGNNITYHSPSRGFAMELGAMTTVLYASQQGKPVSTTHCITGATVGVGLCNGDARAINWLMVLWAAFGWVITLPCAGLVAGLVFAFVAKAPKIRQFPSETNVWKFNTAENSYWANATGGAVNFTDGNAAFNNLCWTPSRCNNVAPFNYFDEAFPEFEAWYN